MKKIEVIIDPKEKFDDSSLTGLPHEQFEERQKFADRTLGPVINFLVEMDDDYRAGRVSKQELIEKDFFVCLHSSDMYAMLTQEQIKAARQHPNVRSVDPTPVQMKGL